MLISLLKKLEKKPEILYADRGFDSEKNYEFTIEKLDCTPLILQKNMLKPARKCKGEYRLQIREIFDYGEYLKRNKIEAIFSALKRKYGCTLTTRKVKTQEKELTLKIIIYNLEKKIKRVFIIILRPNTFQQNQNEYIKLAKNSVKLDCSGINESHKPSLYGGFT